MDRLRIAQFISAASAWGEVTPANLARGMGGRETAIIRLGQEWAKAGHFVECFVPLAASTSETFPSGGRVDFIDMRAARVMLSNVDRDVLVTWEAPEVLDLPGVPDSHKAVLMGMQVAHVDMTDSEGLEIDRIVCLSDWAADFLASELGPLYTRERIVSIPNGIDLEAYPAFSVDRHGVRRQSANFFYTSSPDRGLHHLLRIWRQVRIEINPHAILHVGYQPKKWAEQFKWTHTMASEVALAIAKGLDQPGVINRGLLSKADLALLQQQSAMLPYTCDTMQPTETGCITVTEAMAAGAPVVTTNADCLPSEYGEAAVIVDLPFEDDVFLGEMDRVYRDTDLYVHLQESGRLLAERRTWQETSKLWLEVMSKTLGPS